MNRRRQIFYDSATGQEVVLPVTPASWQWEDGKDVYATTIEGFGAVNFGGNPSATTQTIKAFFPRRRSNLCEPDAVLDPEHYIEIFKTWAREKTTLRYIVAETTVNAPVIITSFVRGEESASGNVNYTMTIRESPSLPAPSALTTEGVGTDRDDPVGGSTVCHTVVAGDTLWALCRKYYGETSVSLCGRVAAHNGLKNPNIILVGQVLEFPALDGLTATEVAITNTAQKSATTVTSTSAQVAEGTSVLKRQTDTVNVSFHVSSLLPVRVSYTDENGNRTTQTLTEAVTIAMVKYCICNVYIGYPRGKNVDVIVSGRISSTAGSAVFSAADGLEVYFHRKEGTYF